LKSRLALALLVQSLLACKVYDDKLFTYAYAPVDANDIEQDGGAPDASRVVNGIDRAVEDDTCPNDPRKSAPGACGCGKTERDADEDGTPDCLDACPRDDSKTAPGVCGCGISEVDSDDDGTPDCLDGCPRDPDRTSAGSCLCTEDRDADGSADCNDECPDDPSKTRRGICGCGQAEAEDAEADALACVESLLRHRYSFNGDATLRQDSVGMADAMLFNTGHTGRSVRFNGDNGQGYRGESYAALPSRVWDVSTSFTLEAWVSWEPSGNTGRDQWQRLIDVARSGDADPKYYFYLTPLGRGGVSAGIRLGDREANVNASMPAPNGEAVQLACVFDKLAKTLALYVQGSLQGTTPLPAELDTLQPNEIWLGRSHFANDPELHGELFELRVWGAALNADQLRASAEHGPNYTLAP
jgi:hypothetical protein